MKTPNAKQMLRMAREYARLHEWEEKARAPRQRYMARWNALLSHGFFTSSEHHPNGIVFNITLPPYLALFPEAKPTLAESEWEPGKRRTWMKYPPQYIGELRPGFNLWVQSSTPPVEKPQAGAA
jgi:hypothetical protein